MDKRKRCKTCGCTLREGNLGPFCSPCGREIAMEAVRNGKPLKKRSKT